MALLQVVEAFTTQSVSPKKAIQRQYSATNESCSHAMNTGGLDHTAECCVLNRAVSRSSKVSTS